MTPTITVTNTPTISNSVTPTITLTPTVSKSVTPTITLTPTLTPSAALSEVTETFVFHNPTIRALANSVVNSDTTFDGVSSTFSGMGSWTRSQGTATGFYVVEGSASSNLITDPNAGNALAFTAIADNILPDSYTPGTLSYKLYKFHGLKWGGSDWQAAGDGASDVIPYDASRPPTVRVVTATERGSSFASISEYTLSPQASLQFTVKWLF